ncbi:MAG: class 1 fructose-bisphosphatase [Planctomycetota bacterium]
MDRPNLISLESHILREERRYPEATGDFSWIMSAIALATKAIANRVHRSRIDNAIGAAGEDNVHGEQQQMLDVIANELITRCLGDQASVAVVASEENEEPTIIRSGAEGGKYCILFDPLDGSSNLGVSVGVGTIFSVIRNDPAETDVYRTILRPGHEQVAAGYVVYGSSTVFVVTTGFGVNMFELDRSLGAFVLVKQNVKIPKAANMYSVNEAYAKGFDPGYRAYLDWAHDAGYSSRYIGSMVADVHRTLLKGGVFLYPGTESHREGKLRLMYEANPMAMVIEQAGGKAFADTTRILDIDPEGLHQRCPVVMGSPDEVDHVTRHLG